jgi:hypothetical protein
VRNNQVEDALRGARFGREWIRISCPFCADDGHVDRKLSLGVSASTGYYHCHRCATKGRLENAPDPTAEEYRPEAKVERVVVEPPPEYAALCSPALSIDPARDYMKARGLGARELWRKYQIGAAADGFWAGRVIIPMLAHDNDDWLGWIARLWCKSAPNAEGRHAMKYLYPRGMPRGQTFWNHRALFLDTDDPVMIVEGVFDALPHGDNAVACLGKPSHAQVDWLSETKRPIAVVLDGDAWGESWALAAKLRFNGQRAGTVRLPPKTDPNTIDPARLLDAARKCIGDPL